MTTHKQGKTDRTLHAPGFKPEALRPAAKVGVVQAK